MKNVILCAILIMLLAAVAVQAMNVPYAINYQGRLTDDSGNTVPDGTYDITLGIHHIETGA